MNIKKIGVLGSGVMGSGIAAHVASAGCQVELLDIVIDEAAPDKLAEGALAALAKSRPALAMHGSFLKKIRPGNLPRPPVGLRLGGGGGERGSRHHA